jgi:hypothetical protein
VRGRGGKADSMSREHLAIDRYLDDYEPELILGPHDVPFTQYLRPDGRRRKVCIERAPDVAAQAQRLINAGYHFDIEELMNGTVSMTVEPDQPDAEGETFPIASELVPNGPAVPDAVDRLIAHAIARIDGEVQP